MIAGNALTDVSLDLGTDGLEGHVATFLRAAREEIALATSTILSESVEAASVSDIKWSSSNSANG